MYKRKRFLTVLMAAALLLAAAAPAFAQGRYGLHTSRPLQAEGIFTDDDGNTMDYGVWVYGVTIMADDANSFAGLYDCDTTSELLATTIYPKDEIGEATQYDSQTKMYDKPFWYSDGVGAIIKTGIVFVHYGPQPTD